MAPADALATSPCLSVRDERLFVEERDAVALAEEFGTPLFVVSEAQLRANARRFREAFATHWGKGPVDVLPAFKMADVVGHSCVGDRILPFAMVPPIGEGDVIALLDTGAYEEGSASNFNALPRPATVLVRGHDADVIRRRETIEDVFARDVVPSRLLG